MSRRGRPQGAKNIAKDIVVIEPSRCQKCGSSRRTPYTNTNRRDFTGAGRPFVAMIYRRCACVDCGQQRVDREPVYPSIMENNQETIITC